MTIATTVSLFAFATPVAQGGRAVAELQGSNPVPGGEEFGSGVAVSANTVVVGSDPANYVGRAYVFVRGPAGWRKVADLAAANLTADDGFGAPVATSGGYVAVGSYADNQVWLYTKGPRGWHQVAQLEGFQPSEDDGFGSALGLSDGTLVVGDAYANVFTAAGGWHQVAALRPSGLDNNSQFGRAVAISGSTIVVGAPAPVPGDTGQAFIYTKTSTGWHQAADLRGPGGDDWYGISVAASDSTVVVGDGAALNVFTQGTAGWHQVAHFNDAGADDLEGEGQLAMSGNTIVSGTYGAPAAVFRDGTTGWHHIGVLADPDAGCSDGNSFGEQYEVGVSGDTAVIGGQWDAGYAGRAFVFDVSGSTLGSPPRPTCGPPASAAGRWAKVAQLTGSNTSSWGDTFGSSVAVSANTVLVGAPGHNNDDGAVYVFTQEAKAWRRVAELVGQGAEGKSYELGTSLAASDGTVVVGADNNIGGQVYVFSKVDNGWRQAAELVGSDTDESNETEYFGSALAISGHTIVVGADGHGCGRAYIFTEQGTAWRQTAELKMPGAPKSDCKPEEKNAPSFG
jgi:hypothetical protein